MDPTDLKNLSDVLGGLFEVTQQESASKGACDFRECMKKYVMGKSLRTKAQKALESMFKRKK